MFPIPRRLTSRWSLLLLSLILCAGAFGDSPPPVDETPLQADGFVRGLIGSWAGKGTVYGRPVTLDREWKLELAGQFLKADMNVKMTNGLMFRALVYLKFAGEGRYAFTWLDEAGTMKSYDALLDRESKTLTYHALGHGDDGVPQWQRGTYQILSPDSYVETLDAETNGKWEPVARFEFSRAKE